MLGDGIMENLEKIHNFEPVRGLGKVIYETNLDTGIDFIEIGLDSMMKDGFLKDVPVLGTICAITKTGIGIQDIIRSRKILIFAQQVQQGTCAHQKLEKHKNELKKKPGAFQKELEIILTYIDRHSKYTKSLILANFYRKYLDDPYEFSWENFDYFADILDSLSLYDIRYLKDIYNKGRILENEDRNDISLNRLKNCGLVTHFGGLIVMQTGDDQRFIAKITDMGKFFWEIGMSNIPEKLYNGDIII